jgi:hypothetical protein
MYPKPASAYTITRNKGKEELLQIITDKEDLRLLEKFERNPKSLSTMEKRQLWQNGRLSMNRVDALLDQCPLELIKMLDKELTKSGKAAVNIEELSGKSRKELHDKVNEMLKEYKRTKGSLFSLRYEQVNPFRTINHEMGHLQDYALNLKKLDIMQYELNGRELWRQIREASKRGEKFEDRTGVEELDNRWGKRDFLGKLMKKSPEEFKRKYPDAYEFLNNEKIQQTAGEVSLYAQTGIGEFVAEVHAGLIDGKKFSDAVMELYKKYNGPMPKGF